MSEAEHTPTPWKVVTESIDPNWATITAEGGRVVANVNSETGPDLPPTVSIKMPMNANAAFIVRACNNYDALVKALEQAAAGLAVISTNYSVTKSVQKFARESFESACAAVNRARIRT